MRVLAECVFVKTSSWYVYIYVDVDRLAAFKVRSLRASSEFFWIP